MASEVGTRCAGEGQPYTKNGTCPDCGVSWRGLGYLARPKKGKLVPWHAARKH